MTLDQLRVFVAVAEREHLTQAAAALHLTPSAASAAIHALESRYATRLFDRVGRRIELSANGRAFLTEARDTLARAASAERALKELGGLERGSLAIAGSSTIAAYWLPPLLMRFQAAHPSITLSVAEGNTETVAQRVLNGDADLGFIEGGIEKPALTLSTVGSDTLAIISAPDHPLADRARLDSRQLTKSRWILREEGSGTRSVFTQVMQEKGINPATLNVALELTSNEAVCSAIQVSRCLAAVSALIASPHAEAGRLKILPVATRVRRFSLIRHKERYRSKAALAFEASVARVGGRP